MAKKSCGHTLVVSKAEETNLHSIQSLQVSVHEDDAVLNLLKKVHLSISFDHPPGFRSHLTGLLCTKGGE